MIRAPKSAPDLTATTSEAHVRAVAKRHDLALIPAGGFLYAVRKTPLFAQPLIYVARCEVRRG